MKGILVTFGGAAAGSCTPVFKYRGMSRSNCLQADLNLAQQHPSISPHHAQSPNPNPTPNPQRAQSVGPYICQPAFDLHDRHDTLAVDFPCCRSEIRRH